MAAFDAFLKIDGIKGEAPDEKHKDEIELVSFSWGATNAGAHSAGGGGGAGKVSMQDFHFTMKVNKASPNLMQHCCTGKHIPSAFLTVRKAGGTQLEFVKVKFSDLIISSFQTGGSAAGSDVLPTDQISFNFTKIEYDYCAQKKDGSLDAAVKGSYDIKLQKA
ncbi:MAG: type VI secretion system tube protein Hcp [Planctomycetota bacterium]|nr:type VI secretion system tube protein Hcp [Planctomycetota bacterium]